jgi:hypothetical protein
MNHRLLTSRDALLIALLCAWIVGGGWPVRGNADAAHGRASSHAAERAVPSAAKAPEARRSERARALHGAGDAGLLAPGVVLPCGPMMGRFAAL